MDTSKAKKNKQENKNTNVKVNSFEVDHVRVVTTKSNEDLVFFTLTLNGVAINGCRVATGKNGDFISLPQTKGKDGNYYNVVYAPLSDDDAKRILDAVQDAINAQ